MSHNEGEGSIVAQPCYLLAMAHRGRERERSGSQSASPLVQLYCARGSVNFVSRVSDATVAVSSTIVLVLVLLIPVWLFLAYKNSATKSVLFYGWFPVICAMCISR